MKNVNTYAVDGSLASTRQIPDDVINATLAQIVDAIPNAKYRAWESAKATSDSALKHWNVFHAQTSFTPAEWDAWGDKFETEGLLTNAQAGTFKAAKPVA